MIKKIPMPWMIHENPNPLAQNPAADEVDDAKAKKGRALFIGSNKKFAIPTEGLLEFFKNHWSLMVLILAILSLFSYRYQFSQTQGDSASNFLIGIASKTPIFKGEYLEPLALEEVSIARSLMTKNQAWSLLQFSLEQLGDDLKLRSKRDIPPKKPLQWGDIEVVRPSQIAVPALGNKVTITYSKFANQKTSPEKQNIEESKP